MNGRLEVFDPALCCATGVCGPTTDPDLARFAGDLARLRRQGVAIERHNLAQEPGAFADHAAVRAALEQAGVACLPVVIADGKVLATGRYPGRAELFAAFRLPLPATPIA